MDFSSLMPAPSFLNLDSERGVVFKSPPEREEANKRPNTPRHVARNGHIISSSLSQACLFFALKNFLICNSMHSITPHDRTPHDNVFVIVSVENISCNVHTTSESKIDEQVSSCHCSSLRHSRLQHKEMCSNGWV
ncbi:hypothetical protein SDJN02_23476, partial [Cucurbita argyrosperma subsp. argyrosperma]